MPSFIPQRPNFYRRSSTVSLVPNSQSIDVGNSQTTSNVRRSNSNNIPGIGAPTQNYGSAADISSTIDSALSDANSQQVVSAANGNAYDSLSAINYQQAIQRAIAAQQDTSYIPKSGSYEEDPTFSDGLSQYIPLLNPSNIDADANTTDTRVMISDQTGKFIQKDVTFFAPLFETGGVIFPYTPSVSVTYRANYETENLLHSNYTTPYYTHSSVEGIRIEGKFTAQTTAEAMYVISMQHFFKTVTKMFYAGESNTGTPPPVLYLDGYGQMMFDHVPVVVRDFQFNYPNDINYMSVQFNGRMCRVPVELNITLDLLPVYSRSMISSKFDLVKFSNGGLLLDQWKPAAGSREGGWI